LQGKFEFHKGVKVIRCCLGSPGKRGEYHPHVAVSLTQPLVVKSKLHSCLHSFRKCFTWQTNLVSTIETTPIVIKHILTFIPVSDNFTICRIVCRNYLTANICN